MDPRERSAAEERLALLKFLLAALERRHEFLDAVWAATDKDQAAERLRDLLGDGADPGIALDMQVWRMTVEARADIVTEVAHLRQILGRD